MAKDKNSFVLFRDQQHIFNELTDREAGRLIKYIFAYVNDEDPKTTDRMIKIAFEPIKRQLKRDLKKWEETREKRKEAGKLGGIKSGKSRKNEANEANASKSKQNEANEAVNGTVNVTVTDNVIDREGIGDFKNEIKLSAFTLEAAEMNQFTHTGAKNSDFIKSQWNIFLLERKNDPPQKQRDNRGRFQEYFLNWMRTKFPKTQKIEHGNSGTPKRTAKNAGALSLIEDLKNDLRADD